MREETYHCLALSVTPGLGTGRAAKLIRQCGSPARLLGLGPRELERLGVAPEAREFLATGRAEREAEALLPRLRSRGIRVLSPFDGEYPPLLRQIFDPPLLLYALGDLGLLRAPSVAVVGSRNCSLHGGELTRKLCRELSGLGLCIVSGLARGVDAQAHRGALDGTGRTVAVLGCGVDVVYPRENRRLYDRIHRQGCLLSELPCGAYPARRNFPARNRIVSGLCHGVLLTEAAERSGSLITARLALEQNREVWAVPGDPGSPRHRGPNLLIQQGAKLILDAQDILEELPLSVLQSLPERAEAEGLEPGPLTAAEEAVMELLSSGRPLHLDELLQGLEMDRARVTAVLLELELKGRIRQASGHRFAGRVS